MTTLRYFSLLAGHQLSIDRWYNYRGDMIAKIKLLEISLGEKKMQIRISHNSILKPFGVFQH